MATAGAPTVVPRSLVWATSIDVLPLDKVVERRDGYLAVRSPSNPTHWWGNLLIFDQPPAPGDRARWEDLFVAELARQPLSRRHRTFCWDRTDGELGAALSEFVDHGYDLDHSVGLIASPERLRPHPRANCEVWTRRLAPGAGNDEDLWSQVVELQVADRDPRFDEQEHRLFCRARLHDLRALFQGGRGGWYVALLGEDEVVGSCGVVVTDGRGRYQAVDTAQAYRRQGICSRLVVEAGRDAAQRDGARRLAIVADPDYHAAGIYESLGFEPVERVAGVCLPPRPEATR
jgi:ribosomal protein S18 acetylase RimI-like enzyme